MLILTFLHNLTGYPPISIDLESKDVNIDNELAGETIKESAVIKRLTGGTRQRIRIQRKNQKAYDTTLYAKLFFNANRMPDSQDSSDAYSRRITKCKHFPTHLKVIQKTNNLSQN